MNRQPGDSGANNFDTIRILAALGVLVSHSYALTGHAEPSLKGITLGHYCVLVFFGLSGFLVTNSWDRDPNPFRFASKRVLRIFPAFIVVLALSAYVIGALATNRPVAEYVSSAEPARYVGQNVFLYRLDLHVASLFSANPYPHSLNGSLWTLPSELHAYILVAALGILGVLKTRSRAVLTLVAVAVLTVTFPSLVFKAASTPLLFVAFISGACLYYVRGRVPWSWTAVTVAVAVCVAIPIRHPGTDYLIALFVPYIVLQTAYRSRPINRWLEGRDYSYGAYLWAFPLQQLVVSATPHIRPIELALIASLITIPTAAASWYFIEKPALRFKPRRADAPVATPR